jgi:hypothetical protein
LLKTDHHDFKYGVQKHLGGMPAEIEDEISGFKSVKELQKGNMSKKYLHKREQDTPTLAPVDH